MLGIYANPNKHKRQHGTNMKASILIIGIGYLLSSPLLCTTAFVPSQHHRQLRLSISSKDIMISSTSMSSSLADGYAIRTQSDESNKIRWDLIPISHFDDGPNAVGVGTLALKALNSCADIAPRSDEIIAHSLKCEWTKSNTDVWSVEVGRTRKDTNSNSESQNELECILSRIMVQCAISEIAATNKEEESKILLHLTLPLPEGQGCQQLTFSDENYDDCVRHLFTPLNSDYAQMELVDMVNSNGDILGSLPRPYVHTYNILHRGIGMIVTNKSIFSTKSNSKATAATPEVYVHQRTSTKRVFPSLYDMFVGGVSTSGEDSTWTAAREVSEELGLKRALQILEDDDDNTSTSVDSPLSEELFQCTICTSYNRCVVSMFAYTCDTSSETIEWQEEEVAWGGWVPYDIVEVSGKLSIDRLKQSGVWPGTGEEEDVMTSADDDSGANIKELKSKYDIEQPWESWDFVPDGLLVWEAWRKWVEGKADDILI